MDPILRPVHVPRTADAQFATTPLVYFRVVLRRTSSNTFVKRVAIVTPRGLLYLCTFNARATRSLFLADVLQVLVDPPSVALETANDSWHLKLTVADDISHLGSTLTTLVSLCQYFAPNARVVYDTPLKDYVREEPSMTESFARLMTGRTDSTLAGGINAFVRRCQHPDEVPIPSSANTLRSLTVPTPAAFGPPAPPATQESLEPPNQMASVIVPVVWPLFVPSPPLVEQLKTRARPKRLPGLRAEEDFLAMMAFVAVARIVCTSNPQQLATDGQTAETTEAPTRHLLTVSPTGIANVWRDARVVTSFPVATCVKAVHVASVAEAALHVTLPGRSDPVEWPFTLTETSIVGAAQVMTTLISAIVAFCPKVKVTIEVAPPPEAPSAQGDAGRSVSGATAGTSFRNLKDRVQRLQFVIDALKEAEASAEPAAPAFVEDRTMRHVALAQLVAQICDGQRLRLHQERCRELVGPTGRIVPSWWGSGPAPL
jgi:hypothetical protein